MAETRAIYPHRVFLFVGGAWVEHPEFRCESASEGRGMQLGSATLIKDYGLVRLTAAIGPPALSPVVTAPRGALVLIDVWDGAAWVGLWSGVIVGETRNDEGARMGTETWSAVGAGYLLSKFRCVNGWELSGVGTVTDRVGYMPPFNAQPGGDRSAATQTVRSASIYVHDRSSMVAKWTAGQALQHIITTQTGYYDMVDKDWYSQVSWVISDTTNALAYELPETDLAGASVLDALATLVPTSRGLSWRIVFDALTMTATIYISSTVQAAIVGGAGYTLPAAPVQTAVSLIGRNIRNAQLVWAEDAGADIIEVIGARPLTAITARYQPADAANASLEIGWETADETAYEADEANAVKAWSRFTIRGAWGGWQVGGDDGLANTLITSDVGDATYGDYGLTGERTYVDTENSPDARTLILERDLPVAPGFVPVVNDNRQLPVVLVYDGGAWHDISNTKSDGLAWQIEVERFPGALSLGSTRDDQDLMKTWLDSVDAEITATVGMRESIPLRISWHRPYGEWPREDPRVMSIYLPDCELWTVLAATVTGLDGAGEPVTEPVTYITRDDRPRMRAALALLRSYYADPVRVLSWESLGVLDTDVSRAPGALITDAAFDTFTETVNTVIDTRTWTFTQTSVSTAYTAAPQPPGMEAIR